jgi:hypothetical protein
METPENDEFTIDPEMERIWREEEDPSFTEIRSTIPEEEEDEEILEQPEEPAETEDSKDEVEVEETDETEVEEESTEDKPEATEEKAVTETKSESYRVKANGAEYDFSLDELKQLAPKAMDYTKKMQEIAPWRKSISALKESGMGEADVNLMIDALKGDKSAIAEVLKRTSIDALDIDTESKVEYEPKQYGKDESVQAIEEIVQSISKDVEYATTERVIDNQWDNASRATMAKNPEMIRALHEDVKTGIYSKVAPIAEKMKALGDGSKSDLEYYMEAGKHYYNAVENTAKVEVPNVNVKQTDIKEMADKRKAATPTKSNAGKRDVINYLDDNDEDYEEWYKALQARQ